MKPIGSIRAHAGFLVLLWGLGVLLAACDSTGLTAVVDGATGKAVRIAPIQVVVPIGEHLLFTASDGVPPYVFSLRSGSGTLDASTGSYTAPSATGTAVIRVTDAAAGTAEAALSIVDPDVVVLDIDPAALTLSINTQSTFSAYGGIPPYVFSVASGGGTVASATGLFTAPLAAGTTVVRVTDAAASTADATVTVHSAGVLLGIRPLTLVLSTSGSSTFQPVGGTAPYSFALSANGSGGTVDAASGLYVAGASVGTDVVTVTDGAAAAVQATVTVVQLDTTVDYRFSAVSLPTSGSAGAAMTAGTFTLENLGIGPGSATVSWGAYLSADATLDSGDVLVASGTRSALASGASAAVGVTGTLPDAVTGTRSWILVADASDDVVKTNNTDATASITVGARDVDYAVTAVANTGGTTAENTLAGSFTLTNNGTLAGLLPVPWTAYLSANATLETASDTVIASGSRAALAAGASEAGIAVAGTWSSAGTWYLIVRASAPDDVDSTDDTGASAAVSVGVPVDYAVTAVASTGGTTAGQPLAGTFTLANGGALSGSQTVYWTAYVSADAAWDAGTDSVVASGSRTALAAGASVTGIAFTGTWPASAGARYLIVHASASDDITTANDTGVSASVAVGTPVNYAVTAVASAGGTTAGYPLAGTFTLTNNGQMAGSQAVSWTAYVSADAAWDAGTDTVVASGSRAALAAGASVTGIAFTGTWPSSTGVRYLIVNARAGDDADAGNDVGASPSVTVTAADVDYTVAVAPPTAPAIGSPWTGGFTITNGSATCAGTQKIFWAAYVSTTTGLGAGTDDLLQTGSISALAAGSSQTPTYTGTLTASAGTWYVIVTVSAGDDVAAGNNTGVTALPVTLP